ncbi:hypothetical protein ACFFWA_27850 [Actinomadura verrucosospora]|uniref:hypothetical protein n=1 Tax=Actinomadura TaxID=1988 RepID=UPI0031E77B06
MTTHGIGTEGQHDQQTRVRQGIGQVAGGAAASPAGLPDAAAFAQAVTGAHRL